MRHRYAETAWSDPLLTLMVRRGSTVRVRQRAWKKALQMGMLCCPWWRDFGSSRVRDGYILGLAGTRGHARPLDTAWNVLETLNSDRSLGKFLQTTRVDVARAGATLTFSFARGVMKQRAASL